MLECSNLIIRAFEFLDAIVHAGSMDSLEFGRANRHAARFWSGSAANARAQYGAVIQIARTLVVEAVADAAEWIGALNDWKFGSWNAVLNFCGKLSSRS